MRKFGLWCLCLFLHDLSFGTEIEWTHHTVLDGDGRYHLYWTPPATQDSDSKIIFKVEVEAHGYIAFGLSPNGGMPGGDMVTGWIKDGKYYFQERYASGYELPELADEQNWILLECFENDTHTVMTFMRELDTCGNNNIVIDDSTMRLIYAYSEEDPEGEDPIYHFKKRGTKSAMLLQTKIHEKNLSDESLLQWEIRSPNFTIPDTDTTYWCKIYKSPDLTEKHHIVYVEPLLQKGNEEFVHHLLLYECVGAIPEEYDPHVDLYGHECHRQNMPDAMKKCEGVSIAWAVGGADVVFPEHVGLPLTPTPGKYFMMEMHYDNKWRRKGIVDTSGLRVYYTPKLRKFDAGTLMIGSTISRRAFIPPFQEQYTLTGHSSPDCLDPVMPTGGLKVLGVLLHSHLIGKRVKARHFRESKELVPLAIERNYDFNYQEYRYFKPEINILPGDQITVECTYDSSNRSKITFGGESTQEEMCLAFLLYYPRIDRYASLSVPTVPAINKAINGEFETVDLRGIATALYNFDWTSVDVKQVEKLMMFSEHNVHCYLGNGEKNSVKTLISYPKELQPYIRKSSCENGQDENTTIPQYDLSDNGERYVISSSTISCWSFTYLHYLFCIMWITSLS